MNLYMAKREHTRHHPFKFVKHILPIAKSIVTQIDDYRSGLPMAPMTHTKVLDQMALRAHT